MCSACHGLRSAAGDRCIRLGHAPVYPYESLACARHAPGPARMREFRYVLSNMSTVSQTDVEFDAQLQSLLGRCASADGAALQRLYELVSPMLFGCLIRMLRRRPLAEEALQDVFVPIWQRAGQYRAERGRPMAGLTSIARYRAIDLLRHERAAPALLADLPERPEAAQQATPASEMALPGRGALGGAPRVG